MGCGAGCSIIWGGLESLTRKETFRKRLKEEEMSHVVIWETACQGEGTALAKQCPKAGGPCCI